MAPLFSFGPMIRFLPIFAVTVLGYAPTTKDAAPEVSTSSAAFKIAVGSSCTLANGRAHETPQAAVLGVSFANASTSSPCDPPVHCLALSTPTSIIVLSASTPSDSSDLFNYLNTSSPESRQSVLSNGSSPQHQQTRDDCRQSRPLRRVYRSTFWCHLCSYVSEGQNEGRQVINLRAHYRRTHEKVRIFRCYHSRCNAGVYARRDRFREHIQRRHHGEGSSGAARPERQITKFARACGVCASVFSDDFDAFLRHQVQHCRNGARRERWSLLRQIEGLLCQTSLLATWRPMLEYLGGRPDEFVQWCLNARPNVVSLLEGDPTMNNFAQHGDHLRATVWNLFNRFTGWYTITEGDQNSTLLHPPAHDEGLSPNAQLHCDALPDPSTAYQPAMHEEERAESDFTYTDVLTPNESWSAARGLFDTTQFGTTSGDPLSPGVCLRTPPVETGKDYERTISSVPQSLDFDAPDNARLSLMETIQSGVLPSTTDGMGQLCGWHAFVGSLNAVLRRPHRQMTVEEVMGYVFVGNDVTPEYAAFLDHHIQTQLWAQPTTPSYRHLWEELTARTDLGADQLALLPGFLRHRGVIDHEVVIGIATAGDGSQGVQATARIPVDATAGVPVAWIYNDNARRLTGARYSHWSMFTHGGNSAYLLHDLGLLPQPDNSSQADLQPVDTGNGQLQEHALPENTTFLGTSEALAGPGCRLPGADYMMHRQTNNQYTAGQHPPAAILAHAGGSFLSEEAEIAEATPVGNRHQEEDHDAVPDDGLITPQLFGSLVLQYGSSLNIASADAPLSQPDDDLDFDWTTWEVSDETLP